MKMKMKMKNNKMFLALVVVAALAMVSVAGVAVLSDNETSAVEVPLTSPVSMTVASTDGNFNFYSSASTGKATLTIASDVIYSGNISFGTMATTYTAASTLTLSGVSGLIVEVDATNGSITVTDIGSAATVSAPSGDISVTAGSVTFGTVSIAFDGKVTVGTSTVTMVKTAGMKITYSSGTPILTGAVTFKSSSISTLPVADKAIVTLDGMMYTGDLSFGANVNVTIADGASVTVAGGPSAGSNVSVVLATTDAAAKAYYQVSGGSGITAVTGSANKITISALTPTATYLVTVVDDGKVFVSELTFTLTTSGYVPVWGTAATVATVNPSSGASSTGAVGTNDTVNTMSFYNTDYTYVYAYLVASTDLQASASGGGVITFAGTVANDNYALVILKNTTTGAYVYYYGQVTISTGISGLAASSLAGNAPVATIKGTSTLTLAATSKLTVIGDLNIEFTSTDAYGALTNSGTINITGSIDYNTNLTSAPSIGGTVNAAYYKIVGSSYNTYTYTTLKTAMANSADIVIIGTLTIDDATLELTGTSTTSNKITISGILNIGIPEPTTTTDPAAAVSVVTVPTTTTLVFTTGHILVANGQLQIKSTATPVDLGTSKVLADVFVIDGNTGIYTDLATALANAVADSTVTLRAAATITGAAVVKSGVILAAGANLITINAGGSLTVIGKMTSTGGVTTLALSGTKAAGEFIINSTEITATAATVLVLGTLTNGGKITVGVNSDITMGAITGAGEISVLGTLKFNGNVNATKIIVAGTLETAAYFNAGTNVAVTVTGILKVKANDAIGTLTVTGSGTVINSTGVMLTVGKLISGTAATTLSSNVNNTTVSVALSATGVAYVYGTPTENVVVYLSDATTVSTFKTVFLIGDATYMTEIGGSDSIQLTVANPSIVGSTFVGWYQDPNFTSTRYDVYSQPAVGTFIGATNWMGLYGDLNLKTYTITLSYQKGVTYVLDGVDVGSSYSGYIAYGAHTLTAQAASGYKGTVTITMTGATLSSGKFTATQDVSVTSTGVSEDVVSGGWTITDILLVIMVIIIAVIAVVVILKLMRS